MDGFAVRMESMDVLSVQWLLKAVGSFARYHPANCQLFISLRITDLVRKAQDHFLSDVYEDGELLIENLCWVVGNISYPSAEFQTTWADSGACQLILDALTKHTSSEEVVQEALRALRNICYEHDANLDLLFQLGVVKALMVVINHHRDQHDGWQVKDERDTSADVLQWVWYAVAALSAHEPILLLLGSEGICDHVASSLLRFNNQPDLVQWVSLAVSKVG